MIPNSLKLSSRPCAVGLPCGSGDNCPCPLQDIFGQVSVVANAPDCKSGTLRENTAGAAPALPTTQRKALYRDLAEAAGRNVVNWIHPKKKWDVSIEAIVSMARWAYRWAALERQWQETGHSDQWWNGSKSLRYSGPPPRKLPLKPPYPLQCAC